MRSLEIVKVVIFLLKINDFEGYALFLSLPLIPFFGPLGRSQKPLKRRPKSTPERYQIQLCLERSLKIASETELGSKMTSQTTPKSLPGRSQIGRESGGNDILMQDRFLDRF